MCIQDECIVEGWIYILRHRLCKLYSRHGESSYLTSFVINFIHLCDKLEVYEVLLSYLHPAIASIHITLWNYFWREFAKRFPQKHTHTYTTQTIYKTSPDPSTYNYLLHCKRLVKRQDYVRMVEIRTRLL